MKPTSWLAQVCFRLCIILYYQNTAVHLHFPVVALGVTGLICLDLKLVPGEGLSIWRFTSKLFRFRIVSVVIINQDLWTAIYPFIYKFSFSPRRPGFDSQHLIQNVTGKEIECFWTGTRTRGLSLTVRALLLLSYRAT